MLNAEISIKYQHAKILVIYKYYRIIYGTLKEIFFVTSKPQTLESFNNGQHYFSCKKR